MSSDNTDNPLRDALASSDTGGEDFLLESAAPKKGPNQGLLAALLLAVIGGGGYFYFKNGPASSSAAVVSAAPEAQARKTIDDFLSGGGKDIAAMERMLRETESVVQQFLSYPSMTQVPLSELRTNPFRLSEQRQAVTEDTEGEARRARELRREAATKQASGLKVGSVMVWRGGATAMINDRVVEKGAEVAGFKVLDIRPGAVVITDGEFRFELSVR